MGGRKKKLKDNIAANDASNAGFRPKNVAVNSTHNNSVNETVVGLM
jgi:hypothetical protein